MGVGFFDCVTCGESICDCGLYYRCYNCSRKFCSTECVGVDKDEDLGYYTSCRFCSGKDATTTQLLEFVLGQLNLTVDELKEMYLKEITNESKK